MCVHIAHIHSYIWKNIYCVTVSISCIGIDEISEDACQDVDHSDSDESDKSDSSDSEYVSEEEQDLKNATKNEDHEDDVFKNKKRTRPASSQPQNNKDQSQNVTENVTSEPPLKRKASGVSEKEAQEKLRSNQQTPSQRDRPSAVHEGKAGDADSDSERELVIDLGEEQGGKERKKPKREASVSNSITKDNTPVKTEGDASFLSVYVCVCAWVYCEELIRLQYLYGNGVSYTRTCN